METLEFITTILGFGVSIWCGIEGSRRRLSFWLLYSMYGMAFLHFVILIATQNPVKMITVAMWISCAVFLNAFTKRMEKKNNEKSDVHPQA